MPSSEDRRQPFAIPADLSGYQLLADARLNKGTAFTDDERETFGLHGLLPPTVTNIQEQITRRLEAFRGFSNDLERYAFLRDLQDTNETLFYALLAQNIEELLPVVYTPTVGAGCKQFSRLFRKPRGLFLSMPHRSSIKQILGNPQFDKTEVIVVTDGERILGLGDQGAGGMGIPIGKLALYTACGGIDPATALPVILDVGTDNFDNLTDPLYIGWRHERVRGQDYDEFIEEFVSAVDKRWPHVMLQWEDFAKSNATRLLDRYRDRLCTFNDDIQGTAAVATGALLSAINVTGVPLKDQRIAILGAGSAGSGIAALILAAMVDAGLDAKDAARRFFLVDKDGLLIEGMKDIAPFQMPFVQPRSVLSGWAVGRSDRVSLLDVINNAKPTALIGVSGQVECLHRNAWCARWPSTMRDRSSSRCRIRSATPRRRRPKSSAGARAAPLSAPAARSRRSSAAARTFRVDQTNNSYIFPGVGLGAVATHARRITDTMFMAAAKALAALSPACKDPPPILLPPVTALREVATQIAIAVGKQAHAEGLTSGVTADNIEATIHARMWAPRYRPYKRAGANA